MAANGDNFAIVTRRASSSNGRAAPEIFDPPRPTPLSRKPCAEEQTGNAEYISPSNYAPPRLNQHHGAAEAPRRRQYRLSDGRYLAPPLRRRVSRPNRFRGHCPLALVPSRALYPYRIAPRPVELRGKPGRQFARPAFQTPLFRLPFLTPLFRARAPWPRLLAPL